MKVVAAAIFGNLRFTLQFLNYWLGKFAAIKPQAIVTKKTSVKYHSIVLKLFRGTVKK